jgi:hypothetical protein
MVVGPALGGVVIAVVGLGWAYTLDVATFLAMIVSVALISPQPLPGGDGQEPVLAAIRKGLAFTWSKGELMGSFAIDILAMTFGMPRALFPAPARPASACSTPRCRRARWWPRSPPDGSAMPAGWDGSWSRPSPSGASGSRWPA